MAFRNILFHRHNLLILLLLVLVSNIVLYYTMFGINIIPENSNGLVIGSIVDLAIVIPFLFITWKKNWSIKNIIFAVASGLILVRFLIPIEYLQPFVAVTWIGFAVEASVLLLEIYFVFLLFKYLPKIVTTVKGCSIPTIFSFYYTVEKLLNSARIIKVFCTEILMFYYALVSWRTKPKLNANEFSLYKQSSLIALYMLTIHSIVMETIAVHWWLHGKFPIVSIVLLILNIYTVIFLVGSIQSIRHNPLHLTEKHIYISFGLLKRIKVEWANIEEVIDTPVELQQNLTKDTIDFIARDFEQVYPHVILKLKNPEKAILLFGFEKQYKYVAIRVDEPTRFKNAIYNKIGD